VKAARSIRPEARRAIVYLICLLFVLGSAVVQLVHVRPDNTDPSETDAARDYPSWVIFQQFALALSAGVVASLIYSVWYGRIAQAAVVDQIVGQVSKDATEEMQRVIGARLDLLPSKVFRTKEDTKGELDLSYARYLNSNIIRSTSFRFRGESGRIAIYRLGQLSPRFQKDDVELHFLLLNPWRLGRDPGEDETQELLTSIYGIWRLTTSQKVSEATISLFDGPLTYRTELIDGACVLSYFEEVGEDSVYYAYDAGTPTYNALRRWFFAEMGQSIALKQAISVVGEAKFQDSIMALRSPSLLAAFQAALGSADEQLLQERLDRRAADLDAKRDSITAM